MTLRQTRDHSKKQLTESGEVFFQRFLPQQFCKRLVHRFQLDVNRQKIFMRNFWLFIITVIVLQPDAITLRDMEAASGERGFQRLTGIQKMSHTAIAERLKSIPTNAMDELLSHSQRVVKARLKYASPVLKQMKVFDGTTFSVSAKHYDWAVTRRSRANVRFLFVMDSYSGTPDAVLDASASTSDNVMFQRALDASKRGQVFVFDRGFSKFQVFSRIVERRRHFITRWNKKHRWEHISDRKIASSEKLEGFWVIRRAEIGYLGHPDHPQRLTVRRITCYNLKTRKYFIVITSNRQWTPSKIVQMYVYRWPIEVLFRHMKSTLRLVHFPSHDAQGVRNWVILVLLSLICIVLLTLPKRQDYKVSLMVRHSSFKPRVRQARSLLREWMVLIVIVAGE